jgi:hypothetical protein
MPVLHLLEPIADHSLLFLPSKVEDRETATAGPLLRINRGPSNKGLTHRSDDHHLHRSDGQGMISKLEERIDRVVFLRRSTSLIFCSFVLKKRRRGDT